MSSDIKFTKVFMKFRSKELGELQFRRYNLNDLISIEKQLEKLSDDKEFVYRNIYNQLYSPKIEFSKFQEITKQDIKKIARRFINKERNLFRYFKESTEEEFYKNFRDSIKHYKSEEYKRFQESLEPIRKTLEGFRNRFSNVISQVLFPSASICPAKS